MNKLKDFTYLIAQCAKKGEFTWEEQMAVYSTLLVTTAVEYGISFEDFQKAISMMDDHYKVIEKEFHELLEKDEKED